MIIKEKDSIKANVAQLEEIREISDLPKEKILQVEKELKLLKSGDKGEQNSAYFIDFYYKDSKNWAIIHDLRIEHNGLTAQIDHLLINRRLDFYVLETKHYNHGIKITDHGEFLVLFQKQYVSIESPIEQNKRHIKVLSNILHDQKIMPKKLGVTLQPNFLSYILISPKSRVIRPKAKFFNTDMIIKSDKFYQQTQDNINNEDGFSAIRAVAKIIPQDSLKEVADKLVSYHKPSKINYYERFDIARLANVRTVISNLDEQKQESRYFCFDCKKSITKNVAIFCFSHKSLFHGKAYCYDCQKRFP